MFRDELEALKNRYLSRFSLYHTLSREKTDAAIHHGRIDESKCRQLTNTLIRLPLMDEIFICGPQGMTDTVKAYLLQQGVPPERIHVELFATAGKQAARQVAGPEPAETPKSRVTIRIDGVESHFELAYDSHPILDAALHEGLDVPFACKGGMCCTCKARLVQGEVDMEVHYGLEHDEIAAGYILTCQSHPKSSTVVVDYDDR